MAVTLAPSPTTSEQVEESVRSRLWTREEVYRLAAAGILHPEERLELLDGELWQHVTKQNPPHATGIQRTARQLQLAFGATTLVRQQLPLFLHKRSQPAPDLLVVTGTIEDYEVEHPRASDVLLLVEIADTTLRFDRGRKLKAYARFGIPEYWIVNLPDRRLEVYRDPAGPAYQSVTLNSEEEVVAPLRAPDAAIRVGDLLPSLRSAEQG
jgi:Uma2 family endonuclease